MKAFLLCITKQIMEMFEDAEEDTNNLLNPYLNPKKDKNQNVIEMLSVAKKNLTLTLEEMAIYSAILPGFTTANDSKKLTDYTHEDGY